MELAENHRSEKYKQPQIRHRNVMGLFIDARYDPLFYFTCFAKKTALREIFQTKASSGLFFPIVTLTWAYDSWKHESLHGEM